MGQREAISRLSKHGRQESAEKDATRLGAQGLWSEIDGLDRFQTVQLQMQGGGQYAKLERAQKKRKNSNELK